MTERDSKSIARRWNREIEDEIRRLSQAQSKRGPWRALVWAVLWVVWLAVLILVFAVFKSFR